jgi:hypothetical protein
MREEWSSWELWVALGEVGEHGGPALHPSGDLHGLADRGVPIFSFQKKKKKKKRKENKIIILPNNF